jgi:hypothetical protein
MDAEPLQTELPKAEPKRKRRWFQFSLRSLMIGVTLLAVPFAYVGWQAKIVRQRQAMLFENPRIGLLSIVESVGGEKRLPWIRRCLGDLDPGDIVAVDDASESELEKYRSAFPEANVLRKTEMLKLYPPGAEFSFLDEQHH